MMDSTDMSTPVTRGELQDTLGLFHQEVRVERQQELQAVVAPLATKAELRQAIEAAVAPLATKAELHQAIEAAVAPLATKAELQAATLATKAELQAATLATKAELQAATLATKAELEMWGGALVARIQQGEQRIGNLEHGQEQIIGLFQQVQQQIQQTEHRLLAELAHHTSAIHEATRTQIKASTEPFDDLPGRVSRLETEVFGPARGNQRTRRRRN
jgi:hypothetical protein